MRRRLLDLTNRNRLLNYKESRTSTLRVIDEIPDVLYEKLVDGKELCFRPVPKPRRDELSDLDGNEAANVKAAAEKIGLNTSFELTIRDFNDPNANKGHKDNEIQTLHFPDRLETLLGKISGAARLAIEETGTNMLFLVFGFLEWYDRDDTSTPHYAPLLLLPVTLTRGIPDPTTRNFRYFLSYSGEDIHANISLEEKIKADFKLKLPELEDEETPESYFEKFEPILRSKEGWKLHRFVTLTLLSFGKLLMYRDLDPANWPAKKKISSHPRIKEFFEGIQTDGMQIAKDYELDEPNCEINIPQLIDNADSSQHSAIIDALQGKNLVIQGPPGTGKSQTITNLIASALTMGKSVLFVSEKLAALEVVRRRLDKAGLGIFCLELHSNKTKKDGLLKDIASRIHLKGTFSSPRSYDSKLGLLSEQKDQLHAYAKTMGTEFGMVGLNVHDIFWRRERLASELSLRDSVLKSLNVPDAESFTLGSIEKGRELAENYVAHLLGTMLREGDFVPEDLTNNPWFGVTNSELSVGEQAELVEYLIESLDLIDQIEDRGKDFALIVSDQNNQTLPNIGSYSIESLNQFNDSLSAVLAADLGNIEAGALERLSTAGMMEHIDEFFQAVGDFRKVEAKLVEAIGKPLLLTDEQLAAIYAAEHELKRLLAGSESLKRALEIADTLVSQADELTKAAILFDGVCETLGLALSSDLEGFKDGIKVLDAIASCPHSSLNERQAGLDSGDAEEIIDRAQRESEPIRRIESSLMEEIDLSLAPDPMELAVHVSSCANAGWFRYFDRNYQAATRAFRTCSKSANKARKDEMLATFRNLLSYQNSKTAFMETKRYAAIFGERFEGIHTAFDDCRALVQWLNRTKQIFEGSHLSSNLINIIWEMSPQRLSAYTRDDLIEMQATLVRFPVIKSQLGELINPIDSGNTILNPVEMSQFLRQIAKRIRDQVRNILELEFPISIEITEIGPQAQNIRNLKELRKHINNDERVAECFNETFQGTSTNTDRVADTTRVFLQIEGSSLPPALRKYLLSTEIEQRSQLALTYGIELKNLTKKLISNLESFAQLGEVNFENWFAGQPVETVELASISVRNRAALNVKSRLNGWILYLQSRNRLRVESTGLAIIDAIENGTLHPTKAATAFEYAVFDTLVKRIFTRFPEVSHFSGLSHTKVREMFRKLDLECLKLYRKQAASIIDRRHVPNGNGHGLVSTYTEAALLLHEISKQKRHIPIRQLIHRAGRALQALKPCFMMGPLSVAQYLAPGNFEFDIVVMDEASQLKPEDALGTVARGSQIIVVGDRKQLPPTSFFDRLDDQSDDDDSDENLAQTLEDSESILDVANTVYQPARMLKWHYRSRHASLIAFSNREFYDGNLIVFPSPKAKSESLGVRLRPVPDGRFLNRRNTSEAEAVIDAVIDQMANEPYRTLGVVAMNIAQKDLLEDLFFTKLKENNFVEKYLEKSREKSEPFFIKNLENVQGDERDVIFVSMTYGPNEQGRLFQRFGPINSATGHRRLNVLFTRSRCRIDVFTSMEAKDILVGPESSVGVKALRSYLEYARTGVLEAAQFSGREADSDFEVEVASSVKELGFDSVAQVGVAGFFIDMAVVHPNIPGTFLLGIECDGAPYHSSRSARDRDRLREDVLGDLGWKLHRVWSVDWYHNRDLEIKKIEAAIKDSFIHSPDVNGQITN